ncbi:hypothetical protein HMPREF0983_02468 [Erysipelotrichaceae bacterium 3_1_53]|nr:hypothetical protein HMPREF0983_02468 [Erysipelotrichaceae bacterium 3_1_53]
MVLKRISHPICHICHDLSSNSSISYVGRIHHEKIFQLLNKKEHALNVFLTV